MMQFSFNPVKRANERGRQEKECTGKINCPWPFLSEAVTDSTDSDINSVVKRWCDVNKIFYSSV